MASVRREVNYAKRSVRQRGKHRAQPANDHQLVAWLGASAITLGMGAALMAGATEASADTGANDSPASSSSDPGPAKETQDASEKSRAAGTESEPSSEKSGSDDDSDAAEDADGANSDGKGDALAGDATDADALSAELEVDEQVEDKAVKTRAVVVEESLEPVESNPLAELATEKPQLPVTPALPASLVVTQAVGSAASGARSIAAPTTVATVVAAVTSGTAPYPTDPGWDAYVDRLVAADPDGLFITRAAMDYIKRSWQGPPAPPPFPESQYPEIYRLQAANLGTKGFALNSQGALVFTNRETSELGLYWFDTYDVLTNPLPNGFTLVRPGESFSLPAPSQGAGFAYALFQPGKQAPGRPDTFAAIAWAGHGALGVGGSAPMPGGGSNPTPPVVPGANEPAVATPITDAPTLTQRIQGVVAKIQNVVSKLVAKILRNVWNYLSLDSWVTISNSPTSARGLFERLWEKAGGAPNSVWVDKVLASDGTRFVVYLGGTVPLSTSVTNANLFANLPAYGGSVKESQVATIAKAIIDGGGDANSRVMLVGYSQGGLDAQNIAKQRLFNVTTVVTFASPILYNKPDAYRIVHLEAEGDPIPGISRSRFPGFDRNTEVKSNADAGNIFTRKPSTYSQYQNQWWNINRGVEMHGDRNTYVDIGRQFDKDSGYQNIKQYMKFFSGTVVASWDSYL